MQFKNLNVRGNFGKLNHSNLTKKKSWNFNFKLIFKRITSLLRLFPLTTGGTGNLKIIESLLPIGKKV